jgi:hypothetical protein
MEWLSVLDARWPMAMIAKAKTVCIHSSIVLGIDINPEEWYVHFSKGLIY